MAQIPYPTGIKPLVKPKAIAPSFPPLDAGLSMGQRQPTKAAPVVQPVANMVRPTGPTPTNNYTPQIFPAPKPVVAPVYNPRALTGQSAYNAQMAKDQNRVDEAPNSGVTTQNKYNASLETPFNQALSNNGLGYMQAFFNPIDFAKFSTQQQQLQNAADLAGDAVAIGAPALIAGAATAPIGGVGAVPAAGWAAAANYGMKGFGFAADYFGAPIIKAAPAMAGIGMAGVNMFGAIRALKSGNLPKALQLAGPVAFQIFAEFGSQGLSDYIYKETGIKTRDIISNLAGVYSANTFQKFGEQNVMDAGKAFKEGAAIANSSTQKSTYGPWLKQKAQETFDFNDARKEWTDRDILRSENAVSAGSPFGWQSSLRNYKTYLETFFSSLAHAQPSDTPAGRFRGYSPDSLGKMSFNNPSAFLGFVSPDRWRGAGAQEFDHLMYNSMRGGGVPPEYDKAFKWKEIPEPTTLVQKVVDKFLRAVGGPEYNETRYKNQMYHNDPVEKSGWVADILGMIQPKNQNKLTEAEWTAAQQTEPFIKMTKALGLADPAALRYMLENHYNPEFFGRTSYYTRGKDGRYGNTTK